MIFADKQNFPLIMIDGYFLKPYTAVYYYDYVIVSA